MFNSIQINQRITTLFTTLLKDFSFLDPDSDKLPGWVWECDSEGNYTACGPEIFEILGIKAKSFIGKSVSSFLLSSPSKQKLSTLFDARPENGEIAIRFINHNGEFVPVQMNFLQKQDLSGKMVGWRGFSQVIFDTDLIPAYENERSAQPGAVKSTIEITENLALQMLIQLDSQIQYSSGTLFSIDNTHLIRKGIFPATDEDQKLVGEALSLDDYPLTKRAIQTHQPICTSVEDPLLPEEAQSALKSAGIEALATIPLRNNNRVVGIISLNRQHPAIDFDPNELKTLQTRLEIILSEKVSSQ